LTGYGASWLLKKFGLLRVDDVREEQGLDVTDLGVVAYPEQTFISTAPSVKAAA
jgi:hypothetical protein